MFLYAPYQKPSEKTIISTNGGNRGNAHSEYLGPLAESGILGLATFLGLIISVIIVSIKTYQRIDEPLVRGILRLAFLGLITYYLHGFLNNFLDMDKASAPFWGFTAIIASLSIRHRLIVKWCYVNFFRVIDSLREWVLELDNLLKPFIIWPKSVTFKPNSFIDCQFSVCSKLLIHVRTFI